MTPTCPIRRPRAAPHLVARDALVELGYSRRRGGAARSRDTDPDLPAEERVREALRQAA